MGVLSTNALAVHAVALRIHELTNQHNAMSEAMSGEERMADPGYALLRSSLMAAYAELGQISEGIADRQRQAIEKRAAQAAP
jgi:hypothetical protein